MVCSSDVVSVLALEQTFFLLGALSLHVFALMEYLLCSLPTIGVVSNNVEYVQKCPNAHGTGVFPSVVQFGASGVGLYQGYNRYGQCGVWCVGGWYQW